MEWDDQAWKNLVSEAEATMSLKEALLELCEEMETDPLKGDFAATLQSYARQIRRALRAAGDPPPQQPTLLLPPQYQSPEAQHRLEVEKARLEFRKEGVKSLVGEGEEALPVYGGPLGGGEGDQVTHTVPGGGQPGMKMALGGAVYRLRLRGGKRCLVFDEVETERLQKS